MCAAHPDPPPPVSSAEELALLQLILGRAQPAQATLTAILERDPAQQPAALLLALGRALAEGADPVALLEGDERLRHVRARRLALQALLHLQPAALATLLSRLPPPAAQVPERLWELEALITLRRQSEARERARALEGLVASPASRGRLRALLGRLR